ncbi:hypothetical protein L1987_11888 [Smallanthus sonchifolius]|uniref:Uncharacterized protein n=1 Tax=Smallanthus sonchifolius TaxID=185202 RepID=A0ACB9JCS3_9ASTR|nr:hypothetical protein L1987_11888 [Smallanthus sonchifolius]
MGSEKGVQRSLKHYGYRWKFKKDYMSNLKRRCQASLARNRACSNTRVSSTNVFLLVRLIQRHLKLLVILIKKLSSITLDLTEMLEQSGCS